MMHIEELLVRSIECLRDVLREARKRKGDNLSAPDAKAVIQLDRIFG